MNPVKQKDAPWRHRLHEILFEADTKTGRWFDLALMCLIIATVIAVTLESVSSIAVEYSQFFYVFELTVTIIFSVEYLLRIIAVRKPLAYITSFYGIVDLISILPFYLAYVLSGAQSMAVVRSLRLLRVFRVMKLGAMLGEAQHLASALSRSRDKIFVFLGVVITISVIAGTVMYLVEGGSNDGFTSIPKSVYWAVVTMTTVGYGDISPQTPLGQFLSTVLMFSGYAIIAVPTGIVSVELARSTQKVGTQACKECMAEGQDSDANYCKVCGAAL